MRRPRVNRPNGPTRRDFLGLTGPDPESIHKGHEAMTLAASPDAVSPLSGADKWKVWVTDEQKRLMEMEAIEPHRAEGPAGPDAIVLNPEDKNQEILGFGGAFSDSSCFLFDQLPAKTRAELFHKLFHPSEMGFNVCRTCIGSADCAKTVYSYDDGDVDPDLTRFSIDHDRAYILPILREAISINPDLFLFSSPWSPPGWMKSNGSMFGGCMRHTYMPSYADYFLRFLQSYKEEGVTIQAVTVQNEVDTDQDGTMPACAWPQDYEADFVTAHLGPLFERAGVPAKIWILDHNYNLWGRAIGQLETPGVRKYTNAVAWHGYRGEPEWIGRVQDSFPEVEMYWTEGGPDYLAADYERNWAEWGQTFTRILCNCCRSITVWNFAADEHGRPYVGSVPSGVSGAMIIHSDTKEISYSGMFWALGHFSKFIRRGARRIGTESHAKDLYHCSFENPGGGLVVVVSNPVAERNCEIRLGDQVADVPLSANSVTTLVTALDFAG
jgi:glucosylceramidase